MRKIITYVAFDDKEFNDREECQEYEEKAYDLVYSIGEKYEFYDENMNIILAPFASPNVEDWLTWLDNAYNNCTYIKRYDALNSQEEAIIDENIGCCMLNYDFNNELGTFRYDCNNVKWVKVDE